MEVFKVTVVLASCLLSLLVTARCARPIAVDSVQKNLCFNCSKIRSTDGARDIQTPRGGVNLQPQGSMQSQQPSIEDQSANTSDSRRLSGFEFFNEIDGCWRGSSDWESNRQQLANCAIGFGSLTVGGANGKHYVVTDPGDDAVSPAPGTLRYGVIQLTPLWITFAGDMTIKLKNELIVTSDKTIDGRGADVHIAYGPCFTIQNVQNVIIHGLHIHDCVPGTPGLVRSSTDHVGERIGSDGDGISVEASSNVWIDHNTLSSCADGLTDVIHASTGITISNNVFMHHDEVMLLGHSDSYTADKNMKVTVQFNVFGPGLVERMPRCRFGEFHVVNNEYFGWGMYAVGGSADPTIVSQGNRYHASNAKEVTKRDCDCGSEEWSGWSWTSVDDTFANGAYFVESGRGDVVTVSSYGPMSAAQMHAPFMTSSAGALSCVSGLPC